MKLYFCYSARVNFQIKMFTHRQTCPLRGVHTVKEILKADDTVMSLEEKTDPEIKKAHPF